jgi:hypothetical protein
MNLFNPGDIVFLIHKENLLSRVIAWAMSSKWSHSAVVAGELLGNTMLIETSDFQVTVNDLERYIKDENCSIEVYSPQCDDETKAKIADQSYKLNGQIYGYLQLISLGLRRLFKLKIKNFFRQGLVCCHVVFYGYKGFGFSCSVEDPEAYDTQELYDMVKGDEKFKLVFKKGG